VPTVELPPATPLTDHVMALGRVEMFVENWVVWPVSRSKEVGEIVASVTTGCELEQPDNTPAIAQSMNAQVFFNGVAPRNVEDFHNESWQGNLTQFGLFRFGKFKNSSADIVPLRRIGSEIRGFGAAAKRGE